MVELNAKYLNTVIIGSLIPFLDKYPVLNDILSVSKKSDYIWDFFMTTAGVGFYLITYQIDNEYRKEVISQLAEIDKQILDALDNFHNFIKNNKDNNLNIKTTVGLWVLWNIKGQEPLLEESRELAPAIGNYLSKLVEDLSK